MKIVSRIVKMFKGKRQMDLYQMIDANLAAGHLVHDSWAVVR